MGIQGLLRGLSPLLVSNNDPDNNRSSSSTPHRHNIRQFANKTLAIDASSWLFKASYSCAERLVESLDQNCHKPDPVCQSIISKYMIARCSNLLSKQQVGVQQIYLVFDGKRCPLKEGTNREREERRLANLREARSYKAQGLGHRAQESYRKCLKVTDWMSEGVRRDVLKKFGDGRHSMVMPKVRCVVSPYEADAQLAHLCVSGLADAVVTEDSDILVYSASTNTPFPIIYKLDKNTGECDVVTMDWLLSPPPSPCNNNNGHAKPPSSNISGFPPIKRCLTSNKSKNQKKIPGAALLSHLQSMVARETRKPGSGVRMFIQACILSGCDYAPSCLGGVGPVSAFKLIVENSHRDPGLRFFHVLKGFDPQKIQIQYDDDSDEVKKVKSTSLHSTKLTGNAAIYEEMLVRSEAVFYYHHVLHLEQRQVGPLLNIPSPGVQRPFEFGQNIQFSVGSSSPPDDQIRSSFLPSVERFGNDIGFIGSSIGTQVQEKPASQSKASVSTGHRGITRSKPPFRQEHTYKRKSRSFTNLQQQQSKTHKRNASSDDDLDFILDDLNCSQSSSRPSPSFSSSQFQRKATTKSIFSHFASTAANSNISRKRTSTSGSSNHGITSRTSLHRKTEARGRLTNLDRKQPASNLSPFSRTKQTFHTTKSKPRSMNDTRVLRNRSESVSSTSSSEIISLLDSTTTQNKPKTITTTTSKYFGNRKQKVNSPIIEINDDDGNEEVIEEDDAKTPPFSGRPKLITPPIISQYTSASSQGGYESSQRTEFWNDTQNSNDSVIVLSPPLASGNAFNFKDHEYQETSQRRYDSRRSDGQNKTKTSSTRTDESELEFVEEPKSSKDIRKSLFKEAFSKLEEPKIRFGRHMASKRNQQASNNMRPKKRTKSQSIKGFFKPLI